MGYNSVKNMPRKQQKAVFARMGNNSRTSFKADNSRAKLLKEMKDKDLKEKNSGFFKRLKTDIKKIKKRQKAKSLAQDKYDTKMDKVKIDFIDEVMKSSKRIDSEKTGLGAPSEDRFKVPQGERKKIFKKLIKKHSVNEKSLQHFPNEINFATINLYSKLEKKYDKRSRTDKFLGSGGTVISSLAPTFIQDD